MMNPTRLTLLMVAVLVASGAIGGSEIRADEKAKQQPEAVEKVLSSSLETVRGQLGKPDRAGEDFESFFAAGVRLDYDSRGRVTKVTATHFTSGDAYKGRVLPTCSSAWRIAALPRST